MSRAWDGGAFEDVVWSSGAAATGRAGSALVVMQGELRGAKQAVEIAAKHGLELPFASQHELGRRRRDMALLAQGIGAICQVGVISGRRLRGIVRPAQQAPGSSVRLPEQRRQNGAVAVAARDF
jgi:hypothetical protein